VIIDDLMTWQCKAEVRVKCEGGARGRWIYCIAAASQAGRQALYIKLGGSNYNNSE
jgi:hypothetical protein